jgi:hypothetical protein
MYLPLTKYRNGMKFELVNDFHSKLDAKRAIKKLRNDNAFFAQKKRFIFSSTNSNILFSHGLYEQVIYVEPRPSAL